MNIEPLTVYIAGSGRSGSTLLDLLINNSEYVQSLGEVHRLNMMAKTGQDVCMCGQPIMACSFWLKVQSEAQAAIGADSQNELLKNIDMMLYPGDLSILGSLLQKATLILGNRFLYLKGAKLFGRSHLIAGQNSFFWFDMIRKSTGKPIVVDSTKDVRRLKVLYLLSPASFRIIYMVRDGRAVAASAMRRTSVDMTTAAQEWVRMNRATKAALLSIPKNKILLVKYEDLCRDPKKVLGRAYKFMGIPFSAITMELIKEAAHNIGGNPMRFRRDERKIVLDERWREQLTEVDLELFERRAGAFNRKLGYC